MGMQTTPEMILAILKAWDDSQGAWPKIRYTDLAKKFGVHRDTIRKVILNREKVKNRNEILGYGNASAKKVNADESIVLAIPDLHCPFEHPDALEFLKAVRDKVGPTHVVCLGDEIDAHALSRYPKDPDGLTAGAEIQEAKLHLYEFYKEFSHVLVCESNHTVRPWKVAYQSGLPASFLPTYSKFLNAPDGWVWKNHHIIDGVRYFHGDAGKSGQYAHVNYLKAFRQSVVIGHIHGFAGVNYEGDSFAMNCGCLIDESAYCFSYAKNMPTRPSLGCGVIVGGKKANFIPMFLDSNGRWTGKI